MKVLSLPYLPALLCVSAMAFPCRAQMGRSAYSFLEIPTSSHVYGLGGCNVSLISQDATLAEQNPSLLGSEIGRQLSVSYMHYMGSANFAGARFAHSSGERGAWAVGLRYLNYGEIAGFDQSGASIGSFSPTDLAAEGTYSYDFNDRLRGGINLKMLYSNYEQYTAFALAVDLGINYYNPDRDISLSAVLKNLGGQIKRFEGRYDHLPFGVQLGLTKGIGESFSFSITAWNLTKWNLPYYSHPKDEGEEVIRKSSFGSNLFRHLIFGIQYMPTDNFYLDLGYNYKMRMDMETYQRNIFSGFSAGAGVSVKSFSVGVAYAMPHKSALTLLLNLAMDI